MADKEATVYIVDVGHSMSKKRGDRDETDLEWAMKYVWDKITSTVATERKTATLGVIGLRTDGTVNELARDAGFNNITVFQEISQILLPDLTALTKKIRPSNTNDGDAISAIVVAIQMIVKYTKKLKYLRKIVLVTDGRGFADADGLTEIARKSKEEGIEIVILGADFDDPEYGFKEEDKDSHKASNEAIFRKLANESEGIFGTLLQAVEELGLPRLKSTRPVHSYKGLMTLGCPEQYSSAMCIDVERYPRTFVRRPLTASQFVQRSENLNGQASNQSSATIVQSIDSPGATNALTSVHIAQTYQVVDDEAPGGKRDVQREDLAKGYEYGRTAVYISESDTNVTKLETQASLDIIGFIPWKSYDHYMNMSVSSIIIAQKTNAKAIIALSSLIWALSELESYAIARLVTKSGRAPVIVLLAPSIEQDYECLLDVQLPFAEDVRSYKFPPLDRVVTISGKMINEHRNLPSDALKSAMSDYVDKMDLSAFGEDDGEPTEYMQMADTYSPVLHRLDQAIRWRAVHSGESIPPPYDILTKYCNPPAELFSRAKDQLHRLVDAANVKKVPPKVQSRKRARNEVKPLSGLNVDKLLQKALKKPKISSENPIPEFRQLLDDTESAADIYNAATQLGEIIQEQIRTSFGDINYARAIEEMDVMRKELIELEEPQVWNEWIKKLKGRVLRGELGGDRREMWAEIRKHNLGLVSRKENVIAGVGEDESRTFMSSK